MARRLASKGPRVGLEFWGCRRWPECPGLINIDRPSPEAPTDITGRPAAYAQRRFEEERARERLRKRALLPLFVALAVILMTAVFFAGQTVGVLFGSLAAMVAGFIFAWLIIRLPAEALFWAKGVEGERRAAEQLEPLLASGYVVLYGRLIPGMNADIDGIVIGPTGIFVIETKNWSGKLQVLNDRLFVGDHDRTWVIQQIYRGAVATQIALADYLNPVGLTVTPILCAIRGVTAGPGVASGVHVLDGKRLAPFISDRRAVLTEEQVQELARATDQRLRQPRAWEV